MKKKLLLPDDDQMRDVDKKDKNKIVKTGSRTTWNLAFNSEAMLENGKFVFRRLSQNGGKCAQTMSSKRQEINCTTLRAVALKLAIFLAD